MWLRRYRWSVWWINKNIYIDLFHFNVACDVKCLIKRAVERCWSWTEQKINRIVSSHSLASFSDRPTHRKAQKLNHDISVDLSAMAINYHQMVCRRDIIKSNGTDYFKVFSLPVHGFVAGVAWGWKQWTEFISLPHLSPSRNVQIISIFNFHCVWMQACMNVKTDITDSRRHFPGMFNLVAVFSASLGVRRKYLWWVALGLISAVKFPFCFQHIFKLLLGDFNIFLYISKLICI